MATNFEDPDNFQNWLPETLSINGEPEKIPRALYKFASCESKYFALAAHELFLHSRIRMSCRSEFNDPFDTVIPVTLPTVEEARKIVLNAYLSQTNLTPSAQEIESRAKPDELVKNVSNILEKFGIYSLSASIRNPLMWAHYGCSHKGLAFIFNLNSKAAINALPVRYQEYIQKIPLNAAAISYAALNKGRDWLYEREWRVVLPSQARQWVNVKPEVLNGVVLGAKCSVSDKEFIEELVARRTEAGMPGINMYKAVLDDGKFELQFEKFEAGVWRDCTIE